MCALLRYFGRKCMKMTLSKPIWQCPYMVMVKSTMNNMPTSDTPPPQKKKEEHRNTANYNLNRSNTLMSNMP